MKVLISVDMEGVAGIVSWLQDEPEHRMITRRLMTAEANAAVEGALAAGAGEIVVADSHSTMINLIPDELRPEARLVSGSARPLSMMQGVDETFDGVVFVGYHSAVGTPDGVLDHSYSSRTVSDVRVNGRRVGEIGINAGIAGYFGVPVVCVTGDRAATEEARELLGPELVTVPVKRGIGRVAADSLHPQEARRRIAEGVRRALEKEAKPSPLVFSPAEFEVRFHTTAMADMANLMPGTERADGTTVRFRHDDYVVAFKAFRAMISLAWTAA